MNNIDNAYTDYFCAHFKASRMSTHDEVLRQIRECGSLQYTLTDVTLDQFKEEYKTTVISYNKLKSAFAVVNFFNGIVQLTLGILFRSELKVFKGKRELEEGCGRIIALTNVEKGSYYIQRSLFHKDAYVYFESTKNEPSNYRELESYRFHLGDLKQNPEAIISKFNLAETVEKLDKEAFLNKLSSFEDRLLAQICLYDFIKNAELLNSSFLISDEEFANLPIAKLDALYQLNRLLVVRFNFFTKPQTDTIEKGTLLHILTSDDVDGLLADIPPSLYGLISNEQLEKADFSKLDSTQLSCIFGAFYHRRELVKKIPNDKLDEKFLKSCKECLMYLSDDQLKNLNYLNGSILRAIFPSDGLWIPFNIDEFKRRFALIPANLVRACLPLDEKLTCLISKAQLNQLDLSRLDSYSLMKILLGSPESRLKDLTISQLESIMPNLAGYYHEIPIELFQQLDLSKLEYLQLLAVLGITNFKCRISEVSDTQAEYLISKVDFFYLHHLSIAHKVKFFDKFTSSQLNIIFGFSSSSSKVISQLNDDQINKLLDHVAGFGAIVPDDKIQSIRFLNRDKNIVTNFMYFLHGGSYRESRFKLLSNQQIEELLCYPYRTFATAITKEQFESIDFEKNASRIGILAQCPNKAQYLSKEQVQAAIKHNISFNLTAEEKQALASRLNMTEDDLKGI